MVVRRTMVLGAVLALAFAAFPGRAEEPSRLVRETIESAALKGNKLGDPTKQELLAYLPPGYHTSGKRYPVVYFLHGYYGSPSEIMQLTDVFDTLVAEGKSKEFIVVAPNGANVLGGAFYVNSPVTGNWEDHIVKEVVPVVDAKFRTLPTAESRVISGFSMGGYGALNLGMRHPDVFGAIYALGPGALVDGGLKDALPSWDAGFLRAYGSAFAPRPDQPEPWAAILTTADLGSGNDTEKAWAAGFGDLKAKIARYLEQPKRLSKIRIDYGRADSYRWIPEGSAAFARLLTEAGIPNEQVTFSFGHQLTWTAVEEGLVPFASAQLKAE